MPSRKPLPPGKSVDDVFLQSEGEAAAPSRGPVAYSEIEVVDDELEEDGAKGDFAVASGAAEAVYVPLPQRSLCRNEYAHFGGLPCLGSCQITPSRTPMMPTSSGRWVRPTDLCPP